MASLESGTNLVNSSGNAKRSGRSVCLLVTGPSSSVFLREEIPGQTCKWFTALFCPFSHLLASLLVIPLLKFPPLHPQQCSLNIHQLLGGVCRAAAASATSLLNPSRKHKTPESGNEKGPFLHLLRSFKV